MMTEIPKLQSGQEETNKNVALYRTYAANDEYGYEKILLVIQDFNIALKKAV